MPERPPAYTVRRSARARHARLTVTREGEAVVVLPARAPLRAAAQLVEQHGDWLERQLTRNAAERGRLAGRPPLGDGRLLTVNGIVHDIVVEPVSAPRHAAVQRELLPDGDGIRGLLIAHVASEGDDDLWSWSATQASQASEAAIGLEAWLRSQARDVLRGRVASLAPALAVAPRQIVIRDQRSRWGSASRAGTLSFSWRLLLAPPFVLDAVVVHELAHLRIAGHSAAFWALVRTHAPRTDEARRWLRANQRELLSALD